MKANTILWLILSIIFLTGCNEQTLLNELDQKQANEVVAVLQSYDIDAIKQSSAKAGFSVIVDRKQFLDAVNLVNHYNLPSKPRIEIAQMFPDDSLVASPLAEKARLYSAIEQRLEQSLNTLNGVITASLHISYDFSDIQKKKEQDIHLTAIVRYEAGFDDQLLVTDIKRFLKNSFKDVDYENISVVMTPAEKFEYAPQRLQHASTTTMQPLFIIVAVLLVLVSGLLFLLKRYLSRHRRIEGEKENNSLKGKEING